MLKRWRDTARQLHREGRALVEQGRLIGNARRALHGSGQARGDGDRVVVFVHGFLARGPVFDPMRSRVEEVARVSTVDLSYGPFEPFEHVCERVLHTVRDASRGRPVTLVGHSLGGLISRWIVEQSDALDCVDRMITIASPHAGTAAARVRVGPLLHALAPGSRVVERLARHPRSEDGRHRLAIVAGKDTMILPPASAAAWPGAEVIWIDDLGHNAALFDPRVIEIVATRARA